MNFVPKDDGITHINVYSKGSTELGKLLTNFSRSPFDYPPYGRFESVEGFWYYYLTGCKHEVFKTLWGFKAKQEGKKYRDDRVDIEGLTNEQKGVILEAVRCKLRQNKSILLKLTQSRLPLAHYYYYGDVHNPKIYNLPQYDWLIDELVRIRDLMQKDFK